MYLKPDMLVDEEDDEVELYCVIVLSQHEQSSLSR